LQFWVDPVQVMPGAPLDEVPEHVPTQRGEPEEHGPLDWCVVLTQVTFVPLQ
jgi:hypothetical protein